MATCHNCGSELTGMYCNTCGERAQEETASSRTAAPQHQSKQGVAAPRQSQEQPRPVSRPAPKTAPRHRPQKGGGSLSPQRVTRTTATILLGLALFGGGVVSGFYLAQGTSGAKTVTSTAENATQTADASLADPAAELPPLVRAGILMDQGVDYMQKGQRPAAVDKFRKSAAEYEKIIAEDPKNLYAASYLGLVQFYIGDGHKAVETEKKVLEKDPNYLWSIFNLAWMYESTGKQTEALGMYKKYVEAAPKEKENKEKYAEQLELIDKQLESAKNKVAGVQAGGTTK